MNNTVQRKQILIVLAILFLIIIVKLFQLQILSGKRYFRLAEANRIRKVYTPAPRGRIYDRNKKIIADSRPSFAISVIPLEADSQTIINLSNFAQIDYEGIRQLFDNIAYLRTPIKVKRNIDMPTVLKLEENSKSLAGISVEIEPIRTYPDGSAALKDIDLTVLDGEFLLVCGPNGSGKTTLIRHMNGLLKPVSGSVSVNGIDAARSQIGRAHL
jgi:cell division protein FtsI/penicillin-binding protein 2